MSTIGSPLQASIIQAAQAQQVAGKARDRQRAASESSRRLQDMLDLRVAGVELPEAVRPSDGGSNPRQDFPSRRPPMQPDDDQGGPGVDLRA